MKKIVFAGVVCALLFAACRMDKYEFQQDNQLHEDKNIIFFTKEQQTKIEFAIEQPNVEFFGQVIKTIGRIESTQADETILPAKMSGIILFDENIVEGQAVYAGRKLFTVSGSGMVEKNVNLQFIEAQANFRKAEADYKRVQELLKDKIVSNKEFLEIKNIYETAKAVYDNLNKSFSADGQRISCSTSGFIKQLFVSNGQYVEAGQPLVSISKNKSLFLKADVQMKYAHLLPAIVSANIRAMNKSGVYSLPELNGQLLSYGKSANEDNYMLPVTFRIDNRGDFISGSFVEIYIKTQSNKPVMTIPSTSITEEQGIYFVYIQQDTESFEKREVQIGTTDGIKTEILSGLNPDEKVVSKGAVSVKVAQFSGSSDTEAEHAH
ncbi:MAG: efflux RND transporter periplasmic adaptor subunit [Dysgonamonadaceae bacterium]|jgi:RND family efflux transporter MFP subunit|nr:efflux RND transporter periplasmic adaptor subunit [Dysgonamonadaceae bacterium]